MTEGTREIHQHTQCPGRDLNWVPLEYKHGTLPLNHHVQFFMKWKIFFFHLDLCRNYPRYFLQALKIRRLIAQDFADAWSSGIDVLLTPTTLTDAPRYSQFISLDNREQCASQDYCTQPANMAGKSSRRLTRSDRITVFWTVTRCSFIDRYHLEECTGSIFRFADDKYIVLYLKFSWQSL